MLCDGQALGRQMPLRVYVFWSLGGAQHGWLESDVFDGFWVRPGPSLGAW